MLIKILRKYYEIFWDVILRPGYVQSRIKSDEWELNGGLAWGFCLTMGVAGWLIGTVWSLLPERPHYALGVPALFDNYAAVTYPGLSLIGTWSGSQLLYSVGFGEGGAIKKRVFQLITSFQAFIPVIAILSFDVYFFWTGIPAVFIWFIIYMRRGLKDVLGVTLSIGRLFIPVLIFLFFVFCIFSVIVGVYIGQ